MQAQASEGGKAQMQATGGWRYSEAGRDDSRVKEAADNCYADNR